MNLLWEKVWAPYSLNNLFLAIVTKKRRPQLTLDLEELNSKDWNILLTNAQVVKYKKNCFVFSEGNTRGSYL
jgi:hypothetical protein